MGRHSYDFYENTMRMGYHLLVNDDLSVSYGVHESEQSKAAGRFYNFRNDLRYKLRTQWAECLLRLQCLM